MHDLLISATAIVIQSLRTYNSEFPYPDGCIATEQSGRPLTDMLWLVPFKSLRNLSYAIMHTQHKHITVDSMQVYINQGMGFKVMNRHYKETHVTTWKCTQCNRGGWGGVALWWSHNTMWKAKSAILSNACHSGIFIGIQNLNNEIPRWILLQW